MISIGFGVFFLVLGAFCVWTGTLGADWNSTHDRSFHRTPRVSKGQTTYNSVVGVIVGIGAIAVGIVGLAGFLHR